MRTRLMLGLLSAGLVVAILPGVVVAKGATPAEVAECRGAFASYGFANVGECVSHVATGGTLVTLFQTACESLDGEYRETFTDYLGNTAAPACLWEGISAIDHNLAYIELNRLCSVGSIAQVDPAVDPDYVGCLD